MESFCVVCVSANDHKVYHSAHWELPSDDVDSQIAGIVSRAAKYFGHNDFSVFVTDIAR